MLKDTYFEIRNVDANFAKSGVDYSIEGLLGEVHANKVKTLESSFEQAYVEWEPWQGENPRIPNSYWIENVGWDESKV